MKYVLVLSLLVLSACANQIVKPEYDQDHSARDLKTSMVIKGSVQDEDVGIKNGDLIVQRKSLLTEELRDLRNRVFEIQAEVYGTEMAHSEGTWGAIKACKIKLASKYNGGDGKMPFMEPMDRIADKDVDYTVGLDEQKKLVAVSEEYITDRITRFKDYKRILLERRDRLNAMLDTCHADLEAQLYNLGHQENVAGQ